MSNTNPPNPRRGEVWDVKFNPGTGSETRKIRPALVISSNGVGLLPIKLVVPMTGWKPAFSGNIWHVRVKSNAANGLTKDSVVDAMQIRAVAVEWTRFIKCRGKLNATLMQEIAAAIAAIIEHE